jgi:hypothetical protein
MTGNTLTTNPLTGTNAYVNGAYGTPPQGFWGNTVGIAGPTPFGFATPAFQPQVVNPINTLYPINPMNPLNPMNTLNPFTSPMVQQPGFVAQTTPWQTGFTTPQYGLQGTVPAILPTTPQHVLNTILQTTPPQVLNAILQTTPPQVVNTILQTTPPQVLPYILNALACQQACQQVLAQNPQAVLGIHPQTITQPFLGYGTTNQGQFGFSPIGGFGYTTTPIVGGLQPMTVPQLMPAAACVGCAPGMQQWVPTAAFQGGFGQVVPQQPWFNTTYGTW